MPSVAFFEEILRYVRWASADGDALRLLLPHVRPQTQLIAEEFYDRIREHPQALHVFQDDAQVHRLQTTLQLWVIRLLEGPHDTDYFEQRCRIGEVHARIGLPQHYMFTAMSLIRMRLETIVDDVFATDAPTQKQVRLALAKILDVELCIMVETFRAALLARLEGVERLQRDKIARRLAAAEERYRDAIESAEAIVVVLNDNGDVALWNRKAEALTGYAKDEVLHRSPLHVLIDDVMLHDEILTATPGQALTLQAPLVTRAGRQRWLRWFVSVTVDAEPGTKLRYLIGVDLTDVREAEQRARQAERLAAVGTLAAGLAHEIRNPLHAASLHLSLLDRSLKTLEHPPPAACEATDVLRDEMRRLSNLVTEFLDFARPRPQQRTTGDLREVLAHCLQLLAPDATARAIELGYDPPLRPLWISMDAERIQQVVLNLVRNAFDALTSTPHGRVTIRAYKSGLYVDLTVEDNGPGFPDNAPIFDAFYTTKKQGTGLGLSIVHRIIDGHQGHISARRKKGETIFTVRLDAVAAPAPETGDMENQHAEDASRLRNA